MSPWNSSILGKVDQRLSQLPLPCSLVLPGGQRVGPSNAKVEMRLRDQRALWHISTGQIGKFAEDYVEGLVDILGNLRDLMRIAPALLHGDPRNKPSHTLPRLWLEVRRALWERTQHSRQKDATQIQSHYDISDDFYGLWLDPRRVYSCAYFADPAMDLAQAQEAKLDHICHKLMLQSGERFIDIGAGWGGLLLWAAEHYGVDATGITLSKNQHTYVNRLIVEKGLQGRVRMLLQDYRDVDESQPFDKLASIGMCEHVGQPHLRLYFSKIRRLLKPGGLVLNHGITAGGTNNSQLAGGMGDFIEKYIFPGGQLVHISVMMEALARGGLEGVDAECLRPHYAKTLWYWVDALEANIEEARRILGARAEKVLRAYRLYLAGSAMGFEQGWISLFQILGARPDGTIEDRFDSQALLRAKQSAYPFTRGYQYVGKGGTPGG
jgi:cyclopropane-fatty-acyl-phospholipid synthase